MEKDLAEDLHVPRLRRRGRSLRESGFTREKQTKGQPSLFYKDTQLKRIFKRPNAFLIRLGGWGAGDGARRSALDSPRPVTAVL